METLQKEFGTTEHRYHVLSNPDYTTNKKKPWCSFYQGQPLDLHGSYEEAVERVRKELDTKTNVRS